MVNLQIEVNVLLKKKKWAFLLLLLPVVIFAVLFIKYETLAVYTFTKGNTLTYKDRVYYTSPETYQEYYDTVKGGRKFTAGRLIGKTNNSSFWGFKETVYSIEGKPSEEVVFVKGLMFEDVLKTKD